MILAFWKPINPADRIPCCVNKQSGSNAISKTRRNFGYGISRAIDMKALARRTSPYAYEPCGGDAQAFGCRARQACVQILVSHFQQNRRQPQG